MHVLGTPPAFILSQDQTRHPMYILNSSHADHCHMHVLAAIMAKLQKHGMLFADYCVVKVPRPPAEDEARFTELTRTGCI